MPLPNELEDEHWELIEAFVRQVAAREGVDVISQPENGLRILKEHWLFIVDKSNLKTDVEATELADLEAHRVESADALAELDAEIARRKRTR